MVPTCTAFRRSTSSDPAPCMKQKTPLRRGFFMAVRNSARDLPRSKAFRALRVLLSCMAKKVSKEGHPVGPSSALCADDAQSGVAFPEGTSLCRPETSRIVRDALRVFAPPLLAGPQRAEKQRQKPLLTAHSRIEFQCAIPCVGGVAPTYPRIQLCSLKPAASAPAPGCGPCAWLRRAPCRRYASGLGSPVVRWTRQRLRLP